MTERVIGPTGSKRRRRFMVGPLLLIAACALMFTAGAQAVHDDGLFELDRNAVDDPATAGEDWDKVFAGTSTAAVSRFIHEADNQTIFTGGGSKDDLNVNQWQHTNGAVPDKDDLHNGYAARYGDDLFFGADRVSSQRRRPDRRLVLPERGRPARRRDVRPCAPQGRRHPRPERLHQGRVAADGAGVRVERPRRRHRRTGRDQRHTPSAVRNDGDAAGLRWHAAVRRPGVRDGQHHRDPVAVAV